MSIKCEKLKIPDLKKISHEKFYDPRGYFTEVFKKSDFVKNGIVEDFVQDNFSFSNQNVLRGLHFQIPPKTQAKLVGVLEGKIWDVVVDIRKDSPTFKHWLGIELSEDSGDLLYIPSGFAHGFVVLSKQARVVYKTSSEYDASLERGIVWNDPVLNIAWPIKNPIISEKDKALPFLQASFLF